MPVGFIPVGMLDGSDGTLRQAPGTKDPDFLMSSSNKDRFISDLADKQIVVCNQSEGAPYDFGADKQPLNLWIKKAGRDLPVARIFKLSSQGRTRYDCGFGIILANNSYAWGLQKDFNTGRTGRISDFPGYVAWRVTKKSIIVEGFSSTTTASIVASGSIPHSGSLDSLPDSHTDTGATCAEPDSPGIRDLDYQALFFLELSSDGVTWLPIDAGEFDIARPPF